MGSDEAMMRIEQSGSEGAGREREERRRSEAELGGTGMRRGGGGVSTRGGQCAAHSTARARPASHKTTGIGHVIMTRGVCLKEEHMFVLQSVVKIVETCFV